MWAPKGGPAGLAPGQARLDGLDRQLALTMSTDNAKALARDLRTAGALVREGDWPGLRSIFADHHWAGLAALAAGASDALMSLPVHQIGPTQLVLLADPAERELVSNMLAAFGNPP